jgi:hypothetical protein
MVGETNEVSCLLCLRQHCGGAALTTKASYRTLLSYYANADTDMIEHHKPSFSWGRRTRGIFKVLIPRISSHLIEVELRPQLPCYHTNTNVYVSHRITSQSRPAEIHTTHESVKLHHLREPSHTSLISHDAAASRLVFPLGY